ncbi:MAG: hypothetical protein J0H61_09505 [Alphaproteobacteria bacterium]|nr:hypothetical protein [Alphaproteobacteria bacterium]
MMVMVRRLLAQIMLRSIGGRVVVVEIQGEIAEKHVLVGVMADKQVLDIANSAGHPGLNKNQDQGGARDGARASKKGSQIDPHRRNLA